MKKKVLLLLSILIMSSAFGSAYAKTATNPELAEAIKLYKSGNYAECYVKINSVIKNDPANALAYYYKAMTATQVGKKEEAIVNYERAITLSPVASNLNSYAKKGKRCLETPDKCENSIYDTIEEEFIRNKRGPRFSEQVRSDFERLKIENMMREMNRADDIDPQKFKEYKDFSGVPTNDEIVAAIRTLQRAGLDGMVNNHYADLSVLTGNTQQNSMLNFMNSGNLSPQLIQAMLTNNMTQGF